MSSSLGPGPQPVGDAGSGLVPHPPFYFDSRRVRIDWRLLHSLDLGTIQSRTDLDALSRVLDLIAYGDLEAEDVRNLSETNFLKIFRLAQMIVEYLLYVQGSLDRESKHYQVRCRRAGHWVGWGTEWGSAAFAHFSLDPPSPPPARDCAPSLPAGRG